MGTLARIAVALESIAKDLHILVIPSKKVEAKEDETQPTKENVKLPYRVQCSVNAKSPRWNVKEIKTLKTMLDQGKNYEEIAKELNRSIAAVRTKANNMGWGFYKRR